MIDVVERVWVVKITEGSLTEYNMMRVLEEWSYKSKDPAIW